MSSDQLPIWDSKEPSVGKPIYVLYPAEPADGLDLGEMIASVWRQRWLVVAVTAACAIAGIVYALLATPIYRAEAVLTPAKRGATSGLASRLGGLAGLAGINLGASPDSFDGIAMLRSRAFVEAFIAENKLLPVLFSDQWDSQNNRWIVDDPEAVPDIRDAVRFFRDSVYAVKEDATNPLITVSVEWSDSRLATDWVSQLVTRANEQLRERDLRAAGRRLAYLNEQLQAAPYVELREAISRLIEDQMQTAMLARAEPEYAFSVVDPPREPDQRVRPRRTLMVILATFCGGIFGLLIAFVRHFASNYRRQTAA